MNLLDPGAERGRGFKAFLLIIPKFQRGGSPCSATGKESQFLSNFASHPAPVHFHGDTFHGGHPHRGIRGRAPEQGFDEGSSGRDPLIGTLWDPPSISLF